MAKKHRTVDRIATILEAVADDPKGLTLSSLSKVVGAPKSSVYSLIQGLLAVGYLSDDRGYLSIGPSMKLLSNPSSSRLVQKAAYEHLQRLSDKTLETTQLSILTGDHLVVLNQIESPQEVRYAVKLRARRPPLTTSMGKILLANMTDDTLRKFLDSQPEDATDAVQRFCDEISLIRESNVAYNDEETTVGVCAVGSGVRNASNEVIAAVCIAGPAYRMNSHLRAFAGQVRATAEAISVEISHREQDTAQ